MYSLAVTLWKLRLDPYVMKNDATEDSGLQPFTEKLRDQPNKTSFFQNYGTVDRIMSVWGISRRT
jgi:hypothetical protein